MISLIIKRLVCKIWGHTLTPWYQSKASETYLNPDGVRITRESHESLYRYCQRCDYGESKIV